MRVLVGGGGGPGNRSLVHCPTARCARWVYGPGLVAEAYRVRIGDADEVRVPAGELGICLDGGSGSRFATWAVGRREELLASDELSDTAKEAVSLYRAAEGGA